MLASSSKRSFVAAVRFTASFPSPSSYAAACSLTSCASLTPPTNGNPSNPPFPTPPNSFSPTAATFGRCRHPSPFVISRRNDVTAAESEFTNQASDASVQKFEYQAEVSRLLDIIVHSLYSQKEVFLRELISNASDALDKFRFLSVTDPSLLNSGAEMQIRIESEPENGVLHITDTGIGMTKEELIENLGKIAQSGTLKFLDAIKDNKGGAFDENLIGKFGVGFYSAFLVADKVAVSTKSPKSDKQYVWIGEADSNSYIVHEESNPERVLPRGTCITLFLKKDAKEYCGPTKISNLVKNYSQFISFPIYLLQEKTREIEVADTDVKGLEASQITGSQEKRTEQKKKKVSEKYYEWELVNNTKPIWMRNPKEVAKEEYIEFCKKTFDQVLEPMAHSHFITEGEIEFRALLYIPGMAPITSEETSGSKIKNIRLYAKRVFISNAFDGDLFPRYLSFVKGVVDSNDIPLNVSREMLQESRTVNLIRKRLMKKTFEMIEGIERSDDKQDYKKFWKNFGKYLKSGCIDDADSRKYLLPFLRFHTSKHEDEMIGLKTYVENMKKNQKAIYYFAADTIKSAKSAPYLEGLLERDLEVLYLIESIDELLVTNLKSYEGKKFVDISKEDFDLGGKEKSKDDDLQKQYHPLCDWMKNLLGERIAKVQISKRLNTSPCVLVSPKFGWSANMERIMKAQIGNTLDSAIDFARASRILEINPRHPIISNLNDVCTGRSCDPSSSHMVELLYETSLLASGFTLDDPPTYGSKVFEMMTMALNKPNLVVPSREAEMIGENQATAGFESVSEAEVINEST